MLISHASPAFIASGMEISGKKQPLAESEPTQPNHSISSLDALAKSINPDNMSRNEARQLADALLMSGDVTLSTTFMSHSLTFSANGHPVPDNDPRMAETFNMNDALNNSIAFKQSKGFPITHDLEAIEFLDKLNAIKNNTKIDAYA